MKRKRLATYVLTPIFLSLLFSCGTKGKLDEQVSESKKNTELTRIMRTGKLKAVVDYNSTNYFIYRGRPMGFKYELLQHLAKDMGLKLEISVSNNLQETFDGLRDKRYDLIAKNLTVTKSRNELIDFTVPLEETRQVLVQRRPDNWERLPKDQLEDSLIRNQLDLAGKTIHVQKNTAYYRRLVNLSDEIGAEIDIEEDTIYGVEQLVGMVSKGEIDYTVCDENVAKVNQTYFPNLDIETPVSFPQNIAWAVRRDSPEWLNYLNNWIINFKKTKEFAILYNKYFEVSRAHLLALDDYHSISNGKISPFDDIIKAKSKHYGLDWRLTAAVIYQESKFDPEATSWAGAYGLMQVMPESADLFRIIDYEEPDRNIEVGVRMLKWLDDNFRKEVPDSLERIKFVLAAYNVGLGHVKDAQRLAAKYNKIPIVWTNNVDYFLLNKSASKYYRDPVVKWGYCRGDEPYNYVNRVLNTYHHYVNLIETS
ncbi:MltF family protein [Mangrovibacterium diazotrophicum]|uniref:Membrane-bound lytic murein transglycosylase F n=1 Tax=Mangrovibacterium diazotrophicum TaxID=1261403 RepID=A0A419VVH1_9BACT|nr:transporter substrate-binding domain-containing protein [Mangrovibacterium diazotrophicum]RKD86159.1 membrane-bound lytic murein transglycosylase F [Mangrovibacterium diazotrophicum]